MKNILPLPVIELINHQAKDKYYLYINQSISIKIA